MGILYRKNEGIAEGTLRMYAYYAIGFVGVIVMVWLKNFEQMTLSDVFMKTAIPYTAIFIICLIVLTVVELFDSVKP